MNLHRPSFVHKKCANYSGDECELWMSVRSEEQWKGYLLLPAFLVSIYYSIGWLLAGQHCSLTAESCFSLQQQQKSDHNPCGFGVLIACCFWSMHRAKLQWYSITDAFSRLFFGVVWCRLSGNNNNIIIAAAGGRQKGLQQSPLQLLLLLFLLQKKEVVGSWQERRRQFASAEFYIYICRVKGDEKSTSQV